MRRILHLGPDMIDREITARIDRDNGQCALGATMTEFATHLGAVVVAEEIENEKGARGCHGAWHN